MKETKIKYKISLDVFLEEHEFHWKRNKIGTVSNTIYGVSCLGLGLAVLFISKWAAILLFFISFMLLFITWTRKYLYKRAYKESPKYSKEIEVTFSEELIHVESNEGKSDLKWEIYNDFLETPTSFLLYIGKNHFSIIPKNIFSNSEDMNELSELFKRKIKDNKSIHRT